MMSKGGMRGGAAEGSYTTAHSDATQPSAKEKSSQSAKRETHSEYSELSKILGLGTAKSGSERREQKDEHL